MSDTTTPINADQIEFWGGAQGEKWVRLQRRIDVMLGPLGDEAMNRLKVQRGEQALDVGCGTGTTTLALADRVGPEGGVMGIDVSPPMLNHARARAGAVPEYNIEFRLEDAQIHDLPSERFDALYSRFGVMFFEHPATAFANLGKAMKPGGRLAFVCWRNRLDNPWISVPVKVAKPLVELPPRPGPEEPGQFSFEDEARVHRILEEADWRDIAIERFDLEQKVGDTPEEAADFLLEMGPVAQPFAEAPENIRKTLRDGVIGELRAYAKSGGVRMQYSTWMVTARRG